jgi:hypothetical protein
MAIINTLPPVLDIVCYAGDDTRIELNMTSGGDPVNLQGEHEATIRLTRNGDELGSIIVDDEFANTGKIYLVITDSLSAELVEDITVETTEYFGNDLITAPMFKGVWDWNVSVVGEIRTLAQGKFTVIKDVTR